MANQCWKRDFDRHLPKVPAPVLREAVRLPPTSVAAKQSGRTPLEVLACLSGGTAYREASEGRATRVATLTVIDRAGALGFVKDPLQQRLALAFSCQTDAEWPTITKLAYPMLVDLLQANHSTRALVTGTRKYRVRLVLHDAFHDLALLRKPRFVGEAAKRLDMLPRDYAKMYKVVTGWLDTQAQEGAYTAIQALYGD